VVIEVKFNRNCYSNKTIQSKEV